MVDFNVYPNLTKTIKMVKAKYSIITYTPFEKADIAVQLFDENDFPVETRVYEINVSNGFNSWGSDDQYLTNWIKQKLQE